VAIARAYSNKNEEQPGGFAERLLKNNAIGRLKQLRR